MSSPVRYSTSPAPWVPGAELRHGECLPVLRGVASESVSCVITDPPYGLSDHSPAEVVQALTAWVQGDRERVPDGRGFMGNQWDRFVPPPAVWDECYRVLKPGGYMAVFAGSRTADLMGLSIRLAGFEIRDTITWLYGSGFPKSLDVSKAIDKAAGAGRSNRHGGGTNDKYAQDEWTRNNAATMGMYVTAPATNEAKQWEGWGTALKPAGEPIIVARKPFSGTVVSNVLAHGTGGINVDECRVTTADKLVRPAILRTDNEVYGQGLGSDIQEEPQGRWPSNVVLSHTERCDEENCAEGCAVAVLDEQSGISNSLPSRRRLAGSSAGNGQTLNHYAIKNDVVCGFSDSGGASRFFNTFRYQAKAPKSERPVVNGVAHPTVKPLALMEWLVTLFTPPYGVVLDPFTGSGTTGHVALKLGFNSIIIECNHKYLPLIDQRFSRYLNSLKAEVS